MNAKEFILTSSGLKNLVLGVEQEEKFEFIFGQQRITMKNLFAEFISPTVSKLHQTDPTINNICFNDKLTDINLSENSISKFNLLSKGESVAINENESFEMKIISILIDNEELFNKLNDFYPSEINETNIGHYLTNLTFFSKISSTFNYGHYSNIINTISSHFHSIDKMKLKQVPKSILYEIICNPNLRLESEDSLLDFLNDLFNEEFNSESIYFYEEIEYSMLSENKFKVFIDSFNSSTMTQQLWSKLKHCFYTNKNHFFNELNKKRYIKKNLTYGIIDHLTKEVGGNVHDKGAVIVTSSSSVNNDYQEKNSVDIHNNSNYFCSKKLPNSWLKYDFIGKKVLLTGYSITTRHEYDDYYPRNWVIEGSNSDRDDDWIILDTRQDEKNLTGLSVTCTFDVKQQEECYRYLRIRQTGKNSGNNDCLVLSSLEFIGTLFDKQ